MGTLIAHMRFGFLYDSARQKLASLLLKPDACLQRFSRTLSADRHHNLARADNCIAGADDSLERSSTLVTIN